MAGAEDLDLLAASLRADAGDLDAFVEALAAKLEAALPGQVEVERRGGDRQSWAHARASDHR